MKSVSRLVLESFIMSSFKYLIFLILFLLRNRMSFSQENNDVIPEEDVLYYECLDKFGVAVDVFENFENFSDEKNVRCAWDCVMNAYNVVVNGEFTHRYEENWFQEDLFNISEDYSREECEQNATSFIGEECMVGYQYFKCLWTYDDIFPADSHRHRLQFSPRYFLFNMEYNEFYRVFPEYIEQDPWRDPVVLSEHEKCLEKYNTRIDEFYGYIKGDENKNVSCAWECMLNESGMMNSENDFRDNSTSWYIHKYIGALKEHVAERKVEDSCKENDMLRKEENEEDCIVGGRYRKCLYGLLLKSMEITDSHILPQLRRFYYVVSPS